MRFGLFLLLLLAQPAWSELGVMVVDQQGRWTAEAQARFDLDLEVTTDWRALLNPQLLTRLSFEQRQHLLGRPERLLHSDRAGELWVPDQVLILEPATGERLVGDLYHVDPPRHRRFVRKTGRDRSQSRHRLVAEALGRGGPSNTSVVAHAQSRLFHMEQAGHLSEQAVFEAYPSGEVAAREGFRPCPICFPQTRRAALYDDLDRALGQYIAELVLRRYRLSQNPESLSRVHRVARRLLRENHHADQGYEFLILDSEEMNAFAAPTGPFFITEGLLAVLESDDELAGVLGHEIAHSERRHARRQYEKAQRNSILGILVVVATGNPWASLGTDFFSLLFQRGYSRGYEMESDRDGLLAAYGAGYDPGEFLLVQVKLRELEQQRGGPRGGWMRTHPGGEKRVAQARALLDRLYEIEKRVAQVEQRDPGLARYLRSEAASALEDPEEFQRFLNAYLTL